MGQTDWKLEHIGTPTWALYQSKRLFIATEQGVLAALNARTGDVEWRHLAAKRGVPEQTDVLALSKQYLLTLSAGGKYVRKWQAADGALVWDAATFAVPRMAGDGGGEGGAVDMVVSESGKYVVVLSHNTVYFYDATSGARGGGRGGGRGSNSIHSSLPPHPHPTRQAVDARAALRG